MWGDRLQRLRTALLGGPALSSRTVWLGLWLLTPIATALAALGLLPMWSTDPGLAASLTILFGSLLAIGIAMLGEPGQRAPAYALIASAPLLLCSWVEVWKVGPVAFLGTCLSVLYLLLCGWALYRYPDPRLSTWDRWIFRVMFFWLTVAVVVTALASTPQSYEFPADTWWPTPLAGGAYGDALKVVRDVGMILIAVVYIGRWVARLRRARPVERRLKTPPAVGAIVATAAAALVPVGKRLEISDAQMNVLYVVEALAAVVVPISFLVAILRRQMARTRVTTLVLGVKGPPSTEAIVAALRSALEDPSLELAYWSPDVAAYVGDDGRPIGAERLEGQLQATVESTAGERLALVLADPALVRDPDLLEAAATVAGFSLEIARLLETVKTQLNDVRAAGTRAVHAADAERRRMEQDLHDGAQQHLLALGPLLGAAEASTTDPATAEQLAEIRTQLSRALKELREFARGVHPTALSRGLAAAVQDLAVRLPIEVAVHLPDDDLPPATAHAVYLVVSEALANAAKHSQATTVRVSGRIEDGVLALSVCDNGIGGARRTDGLGIPGMVDRVAALGGRLELDSVDGRGTTIEVRVPCA